MINTVPSGGGFSWQVNNQTRFYITDSSNTFYKYLNMSSQRIINVATPASGNDAVNRTYCDGNSGSSGANTSLSNLSTNGENHFDNRYLNDSGTQTKSGTTTFTGETNFSGIVDFTGNTQTYAVTYSSLIAQGYINIKIGGSTGYKIWYS